MRGEAYYWQLMGGRLQKRTRAVGGFDAAAAAAAAVAEPLPPPLPPPPPPPPLHPRIDGQ